MSAKILILKFIPDDDEEKKVREWHEPIHGRAIDVLKSEVRDDVYRIYGEYTEVEWSEK